MTCLHIMCELPMTLSYVINGEDQDMTWLNGPVVSVKGKLSDDLALIDRSNGEEQVKSRSMNQYGHVMIWSGSYHC
jgi:hypothetical protein